MERQISSARAFFDNVVNQADPFNYLAAMVDLQNPDYPVFEEEWLDFKGQPQDDKDARKIWSKALSGYANITDGVIVWGIDARKAPPRDIDAACGLRVIKNTQSFESKLRDWVRDATNPPVMGVEFISYADSSQSGFVVCFVPKSSHKPHRAEWADKQYYYRASDDFLPAEPAMLRLLFYPRYNPAFELTTTLMYENKTPPNQTITSMKLSVEIINVGNESADDVYVAIASNIYTMFHAALPNPFLFPGANWKVMNVLADKENVKLFSQYMMLATIPLHPQLPFRVITSDTWKSPQRVLANGKKVLPQFDPISVRCDVYSRNSVHKAFSVSFVQDDFLEKNECARTCDPVNE
jgi:hypothetical protein